MSQLAAWSTDLETTFREAEALGANVLSVVVVGPDERRREAVAGAMAGSPCGQVRQMSFYPELDQLSMLTEMDCDVIIIDLDSNPEYALDVIENLCAATSATIMVCSASAASDLTIRCMRAGAREFLTVPISAGIMAEAMVRASVRRIGTRSNKKAEGRLCVFWGAKGGAGVTTIATNFAIAAARESEQSVLLIDLDLPLGDAVLNLGLNPQYSTVDALQNFSRLDANFLSRLTVKHDSGVFVLAAPGRIGASLPVRAEAIDRLIHVARQEFKCVVVDTGSQFDLLETSLFEPSSSVYLVSQIGVPDLRNSNRLIAEVFSAKAPKFEVILNRYSNSSLDEESIARALTRKPQWQVPEDSGATRKMQATAIPLALGDSGIARIIRQMARAACELPAVPEKRKKIAGLF